MEISIATDFNDSTGSPRTSLQQIGEAGFTHLHWCHQWNTDFLYGKAELVQIKSWLKEFGLKLLDIHGSSGVEKCWCSTEEYQRKAGVELVVNRLQMLEELEGTGVLMMHAPDTCVHTPAEVIPEIRRGVESLKRSLEELVPYLEAHDQCIAIENMPNETYDAFEEYLQEFSSKYIGITYDSGHGNIGECKGLDFLDAHKDRLMALHLHDNDGTCDQHLAPFCGNVDWERLTSIIAASSYDRMASFEMGIQGTPFMDPEVRGAQKPENCKAYLADAYERARRIAEMLERKRQSRM